MKRKLAAILTAVNWQNSVVNRQLCEAFAGSWRIGLRSLQQKLVKKEQLHVTSFSLLLLLPDLLSRQREFSRSPFDFATTEVLATIFHIELNLLLEVLLR